MIKTTTPRIKETTTTKQNKKKKSMPVNNNKIIRSKGNKGIFR